MRIFIATVTSIAFMIVPSTANATMNDQSNNSIQTCTSSIEDQHHCSSSLQINDDSIVINGTVFTRAEVSRRLDGAISIQERDAVAAAATAVYFIPGIGEVILTAAGAVIVAGTVIVAGSWLYNTIMQKLQQRPLKPHRKNKRKSTYNKHTNPRPGRKEKKKSKPGWKTHH